jgi:hypothetical protein
MKGANRVSSEIRLITFALFNFSNLVLLLLKFNRYREGILVETKEPYYYYTGNAIAMTSVLTFAETSWVHMNCGEDYLCESATLIVPCICRSNCLWSFR